MLVRNGFVLPFLWRFAGTLISPSLSVARFFFLSFFFFDKVDILHRHHSLNMKIERVPDLSKFPCPPLSRAVHDPSEHKTL